MCIPSSDLASVCIVKIFLSVSPLLFPKKLNDRSEGIFPGHECTNELQVNVISLPINGRSGRNDKVGVAKIYINI